MTPQKFDDLLMSCSSCALCDNATKDVIPFFAAGNPKANVLVVDSEPLVVDGESLGHNEWTMAMTNTKITRLAGPSAANTQLYGILNFWYSNSRMIVLQIFGEKFVEKSDFLYTRAVRCAFPAKYSEKELTACSNWTQQLVPNRKLIFMIGYEAAVAVLGANSSKLKLGEAKRHNGVIYFLVPKSGEIGPDRIYNSYAPIGERALKEIYE